MWFDFTQHGYTNPGCFEGGDGVLIRMDILVSEYLK